MKPLIPTIFILLCAACGPALHSAETFPVTAVPAADRVVVALYRGIPVNLPLAHLEVPDATRSQAKDRLTKLLTGKRVDVRWSTGFGADAAGTGRVQLVVDGVSVNETLVKEGLARYTPGTTTEPAYEDPIRLAQDMAKRKQVGVWSAAAAPAAVVAVAAPAPAAMPAGSVPSAAGAALAKGAFASELDSRFYFPANHRAIASVNSQRLIYYRDEDTARKAGKLAPPPEATDLKFDNTPAGAEAAYAKGKEIYAQAIAMGNTSERDTLYGHANVYLTKSVQIYSGILETRPDDQAMGEKMRLANQLRYGTIKQRRFE